MITKSHAPPPPPLLVSENQQSKSEFQPTTKPSTSPPSRPTAHSINEYESSVSHNTKPSTSSSSSGGASLQLPPPPTAIEIEEINKNLTPIVARQIVEPPSPFHDNLKAPIASVTVTQNYNDNNNNDKERILSDIFEEMCEDVISCDHTAPSVPDVILQVISEYLAESQCLSSSSQDEETQSNDDLKSKADFTPSPRNNNEQVIEAKIISNGYNYINHAENTVNQEVITTVTVTSNNKILQTPTKSTPERPTTPTSSSVAATASILADHHNELNNSMSSIVPQISSQIATTPSTAAAVTNANNSVKSNNSNSIDSNQARLNRNRTRKTITKTFVVDGQTVTQTIKKTVNLEEEERMRKIQEERKRELIEHRRNLNEDKRKISDLTRKQESEKDALEQDFKEQKEKLLREFDAKQAQIYQYRKAEIERCEEAQAIELKTAIKRLKSEQEKQLKSQREQLKDEFKSFKKELEANQQLNKEHREMYRKQKEKELLRREEEAIQRQLDDLNTEEKRILKLHKQQLAHLEATALLEKQNLIRTREAAIWELEHRQMDTKYNVIRKHVRDFFYLQRHLMLTKQEKDIEHLRTLNNKLEEDLIRRQNEEKRLFIKSLRQEQRSRREMYRRSLYIIPTAIINNYQTSSAAMAAEKISADEEKRKIKEFEEKEKERFDNEMQRLTIRHLKQLEENRITAENLMKDLEEEQVIINYCFSGLNNNLSFGPGYVFYVCLLSSILLKFKNRLT